MTMELPSLTKTWRNAAYPAISPLLPAHSVAGKTIFITGGGGGIGGRTAVAFAAAGASVIGISGRTEKSLLKTKKAVESEHKGKDVTVRTFVCDITDEAAINRAFQSMGKVDILVNNAGILPPIEPLAKISLADWWSGFEINVKGAFLVTRAFLKVKAEKDATIVVVATGMKDFSSFDSYSSYAASKLAQGKFFDGVTVEYPEVHVVQMHPGVVATEMGQKSLDAGAPFPTDDVELPAETIVWLCSPEASFLKGKMLWCNWDAEELMAMADEIKNSSMLTTTLDGMTSFKYTSKTSEATNGTSNGTNGTH